jgi:hypothetical protein
VVLDIVNKEIPVFFFFLLINLKYDLSWECISYLCLLLFLICRWKFRVHTTGLINIFLECIIISDFNSKIHSKQQGNWSELYISSKSKKIIRYFYFYFYFYFHLSFLFLKFISTCFNYFEMSLSSTVIFAKLSYFAEIFSTCVSLLKYFQSMLEM